MGKVALEKRQIALLKAGTVYDRWRCHRMERSGVDLQMLQRSQASLSIIASARPYAVAARVL